MQFTRTRYGMLAVLLGAALMLAGCGGDDNGGLSAEDMARLSAAEDATAAAQAAAAAAAAEAMTAHEEAEEAKAEAAAAHEEAEAADAAAAAAQAEAAAAKAAADEAMTTDDDMMAADDAVTLADLYEELAGMKIEEDLRMRVGTEGPLSTTVLKAAIMATAEAYHVDATSAIEYIDENYPTFEVLQRGAVETILEVLHKDNDHLSATAMTAEMVLKGEKGDTGDAGAAAADDDTVADLQAQIEKLQPSAVRPPMPEDAKVLAAGNAGLSSMADTYDYDMLDDISKNTTATAKKGTYTANGETGFAGLNALQAGGDGANVFGSWLEYSHWGYILGEDDSRGTFSLGMPTGANPAPQDDDKLNATWKGTMTGTWQAHEEPNNDSTGVAAIADMDDREYVTVRGDAAIAVKFTSSGTGYKSAATLSINNLVQSDGTMLGNFRTGTLPIATAADVTAANTGYDNVVWNGMAITKGDFSRKGITATVSDTGVIAAIGDPSEMDRPSSSNYLAGRFYGTGGKEVGGVFQEDGLVTGYNATTRMADGVDADAATFTAATIGMADVQGTLMGAFGGGREIPELP